MVKCRQNSWLCQRDCWHRDMAEKFILFNSSEFHWKRHVFSNTVTYLLGRQGIYTPIINPCSTERHYLYSKQAGTRTINCVRAARMTHYPCVLTRPTLTRSLRPSSDRRPRPGHTDGERGLTWQWERRGQPEKVEGQGGQVGQSGERVGLRIIVSSGYVDGIGSKSFSSITQLWFKMSVIVKTPVFGCGCRFYDHLRHFRPKCGRWQGFVSSCVTKRHRDVMKWCGRLYLS